MEPAPASVLLLREDNLDGIENELDFPIHRGYNPLKIKGMYTHNKLKNSLRYQQDLMEANRFNYQPIRSRSRL